MLSLQRLKIERRADQAVGWNCVLQNLERFCWMCQLCSERCAVHMIENDDRRRTAQNAKGPSVLHWTKAVSFAALEVF